MNQIELEKEWRELSTVVQLMAGLQYKKELIESIFREGMMRESVMYQEILKEGERKGLQQGRQEGRQEGERIGECNLVLRLLKRRLGPLPVDMETQITQLSLENIELLSDALLDFLTLEEVYQWLSDRPHDPKDSQE